MGRVELEFDMDIIWLLTSDRVSEFWMFIWIRRCINM